MSDYFSVIEERENAGMVTCKELIGKAVANCTIFEESPDGPELCIEFSDRSVFSACLRTSTALEAKITRDDGGQPQLVKDYSTSAIPR